MFLKPSIHIFLERITFRMSSAFLGSSQNLGSSVFTSSSRSSSSFPGMSKMPPQRFSTLFQIFNVVNCNHGTKVHKNRTQILMIIMIYYDLICADQIGHKNPRSIKNSSNACLLPFSEKIQLSFAE